MTGNAEFDATSKVEHLYDYHRFNPSQGRELLGLPARPSNPDCKIPVAVSRTPMDAYMQHGSANPASKHAAQTEGSNGQHTATDTVTATAGSSSMDAASRSQQQADQSQQADDQSQQQADGQSQRFELYAGMGYASEPTGATFKARSGFWRRPDMAVPTDSPAADVESAASRKVTLTKETFERLTSPPKHRESLAVHPKEISCGDIKRQWPPQKSSSRPASVVPSYTPHMWVSSLRQAVDPDGVETQPYE